MKTQTRTQRFTYVTLRHTLQPARVYTAREAKECGECERTIEPGRLYTIRAGHKLRCYDCVPWIPDLAPQIIRK